MSQQKNKLKENITSIVLCAGKGVRAKNFAINIPKPLVKIESLNDQPLISLILDNLVKLKLDPIVVVTGYLGDQIEELLNSLQIKNQYGEKKIIIHNSGVRYKLGPLHSFLSITTNDRIFKTDKIFIVFPGDTLFDYKLLEVILDLLEENYSQAIHNSIIFYRKIRIDILMNRFGKDFSTYEENISYLKIRKKNSKAVVKEISQKKLSSISDKETINQIIPIFIFNNALVKKIKELANTVKFRTIREVVNLMIKKKECFFALSVSPEYNFYDIDTPLDLQFLNAKKKDGQ
ncbi:MAG: NTP transferase domain-containing protein [Candidatus Thorarchaeota archaeon]